MLVHTFNTILYKQDTKKAFIAINDITVHEKTEINKGVFLLALIKDLFICIRM